MKFRWTSDRRQCQIKRQRRPGATQWEHLRVPRDGVITLELPREVSELRVQLSSTTFGLQDTWLSVRVETATESTRSTYSERNSGPKGHCITRRYTELIRLCFSCNQVASLDVVPDCTVGSRVNLELGTHTHTPGEAPASPAPRFACIFGPFG